jgi:hypothetical protein
MLGITNIRFGRRAEAYILRRTLEREHILPGEWAASARLENSK